MTYHEPLKIRQKKYGFNRWLARQKINPSDFIFIAICLAALIYFTIHDPLLMFPTRYYWRPDYSSQ